MAGGAALMTRVFVVETSYLCELYKVPMFSNQEFSARLREKWDRERKKGAGFRVPVGCVYQLCDHIADVPDGSRRRELAVRVATDVESSVASAIPWLIVPSHGVNELSSFVRAFASNAGHLKLGLTNSQVVEIARGLKSKYGGVGSYRVHIWTRNQDLKAHEPDDELDPLT